MKTKLYVPFLRVLKQQENPSLLAIEGLSANLKMKYFIKYFVPPLFWPLF